MQVHTFLTLIAFFLIGGCESSKTPTPENLPIADAIFSNGPVITMDDRQLTAEAVAIADGLILAVGDLELVDVHRGDSTVMIDLEGRTLSPGFIDGHAHLAQFGPQAIEADRLNQVIVLETIKNGETVWRREQ